MAQKQVPMPVMIAVLVAAVCLIGYFGYRKMSPPGYATNKETGVPGWVKDWKPDHDTSPHTRPAGSGQ